MYTAIQFEPRQDDYPQDEYEVIVNQAKLDLDHLSPEELYEPFRSECLEIMVPVK